MQDKMNDWDALNHETGDVIFHEMYSKDIKIMVKRGGASWCGYVGIPMDSHLANKEYDEIDIDCHGGLTFSAAGSEKDDYTKGWYWYGWEYTRFGDATVWFPDRGGRKWTADDVKKDALRVAEQFEKLLEKETTMQEKMRQLYDKLGGKWERVYDGLRDNGVNMSSGTFFRWRRGEGKPDQKIVIESFERAFKSIMGAD